MLHERLKQIIRDDRPAVLTFDFFDTLCLRRTENPVSLFYQVAEELKRRSFLHSAFISERFVSLRSQAEELARRAKQLQSGNPEVSLREIYLQLHKFSAFERPAIAELISIEEAVEIKNLFLYDRTIEILDYARSLGCVTAVVSDSYFSRGFFERIFDAHAIEPPSHVFVSNELGAGKGSGAWNIIPNRLGVPPQQILHIGDNYVADIEIPSRAGIRTFFVPHGSSELFGLIGQERKFLHNANARFAPTTISTIRAKVNFEADTENAFVAYGYQVLGPIFSFYAAWAADLSRQVGAHAIVPLAREGIFLAQLLRGASEAVTDPLFVSRRFMRLIGFRNPTREKLDELFITRRPLTREGMSKHLAALVGDEDAPAAESDTRTNEGLSLSDRHAFLDALWADEKRLVPLVAKAREQADRFKEHLRTVVGDWNASDARLKICLIDVGWNASIQRFLTQFFEEEGIPISLTGLYIMTTTAANSVSLAQSEAFGFLIDGGAPADLADLALRNLEILEQSATPVGIGSLLEFASSGVPTEMDVIVPDVQGSQILSIQEGIAAFNNTRKRLGRLIDWTPDLQDEIRSILLRAMTSPNEREAGMFEHWKHDDNIVEDSAEPITHDISGFMEFMTPREFLSIGMTEQYWPFPNLVRGPEILRKQILSTVHGQQSVDAFETDVGDLDISIFGSGKDIVRSESLRAMINVTGKGLLKIIHPGKIGKVELASRLHDHIMEPSRVRLQTFDGEFRLQKHLEFGPGDLGSILFPPPRAGSNSHRLQLGDRCTLDLAAAGLPFESAQTVIFVGYEVVPSSMRMMHFVEHRGDGGAAPSDTASQQISSKGQGWIDTINGASTAPESDGVIRVRLARGSEILDIAGWFLGIGDSTKGKTVLTIEDKYGTRLSEQCARTERPDLSAALKRIVPTNGGIRARINISSIRKKGPFRIGLLQFDDNTVCAYTHGHLLVIE
ncbi:MAG: HAD family hydrolase [Micropepsaceae bacterium]